LQLPPDTGARAVTPLFHTADFGVRNPPDDDMPAISGANCKVQPMIYRAVSQFANDPTGGPSVCQFVRLNWLPQRHAARATWGGTRGARGVRRGLGARPRCRARTFYWLFFLHAELQDPQIEKQAVFPQKKAGGSCLVADLVACPENTFLKRKPSSRSTSFRTLAGWRGTRPRAVRGQLGKLQINVINSR
jgi:hypothetical protein